MPNDTVIRVIDLIQGATNRINSENGVYILKGPYILKWCLHIKMVFKFSHFPAQVFICKPFFNDSGEQMHHYSDCEEVGLNKEGLEVY